MLWLALTFAPIYVALARGTVRSAAILRCLLGPGAAATFELFMGPDAFARIILTAEVLVPFCLI